MKTKIHAFAGVLGFLIILAFWTSTVAVELFGSVAAIATLKAAILKGMFVLVPALAIAGGSGMAIGGKWRAPLAKAKKRRMPFIAANGVLVLVPSAIFLDARASAANFDEWFYAVQGLELVAGAINLTLIGLNIRDGLALRGRISRAPSAGRA